MQVAIVGAGIIGASLAYALGRQGAQVTIVDAAGPAAGATGASFGWINASYYADAAHFALRAASIEAYRQLCRVLDVPVYWSGCLCWEEEGEALEAQERDLRALGYHARIVDRAELARLEPQVKAADRAILFEDEAAAEPGSLTQALLKASGARVMTGCRVSGILAKGSRVCGLRIPGGDLPADAVVVAGGNGSTDLLSPLGVALPMLDRPGVIFRTAPIAPTLSHICVAPAGEFRQTPEGQIVMPTAVSNQADDTNRIWARPDQLADAALERLQAMLPGTKLVWQDVALAQRPVPQDGLPVVGACGPEGLFTAVMHSGITLAPVVAEILSAQVLGAALSNAQQALIAPYRPDRFG
ncbi:NAD(P)/FAD-dependent oxidoreductase [Sulfitobacter aestuariivivens]|uniref:FAD-binding oxidoreductase n=1 Tax=Sulfitobacter aestuariivivens TaxID=2766981 RepID=A0A927D327_9RHOB|nr:FAD-dependent oxidoreductase [Sulfitobacter aestuariivivens]MBD3663418.1 FAD-binding oxidoreductase [Sulfitobacter aestuariivivens]